MAHEIFFDINTKFVLKKDVTFEIKKDGKKLGELLISQGNLEWMPAKGKVRKHRIEWDALDSFMKENGTEVVSVKKRNAMAKKRAAKKAAVVKE
jgi:hypothetical protein